MFRAAIAVRPRRHLEVASVDDGDLEMIVFVGGERAGRQGHKQLWTDPSGLTD